MKWKYTSPSLPNADSLL
jgi:hypothetical protein